MTVNTASSMAEIKLDMMELKLDRLIDEMRFLKSRTFAFDTRLPVRGAGCGSNYTHSRALIWLGCSALFSSNRSPQPLP